MRGTRGALMVCGTASDVGKSQIVAGLCRVLLRHGARVAPFKAQNMSLNSYVTMSGHEIGRAQGVQALAAGVEPEVAMNPILLKPTGDRTCQVVLNGEPIGHLDAAAYHDRKPGLVAAVLDALADLRRRFDVVVAEGAGGAAEINLLAHDIVNLPIAARAGLPAIVVGDIDRGGVFASLYGTVALLPEEYRRLVRGFVINKFRGDPALLGDGLSDLEGRCGVPTLGVVPWLSGVALDAEDSLALSGQRPMPDRVAVDSSDGLDVAVVRFPHISNFTDLDALALEPGVAVRFVHDVTGVGDPDLLLLPGTKATVDDLGWMRRRGLDRAVRACRRRGTVVVGVCGGYQMLGRRIVDAVESGAGDVAGLALLDVDTVFEATKVTRRRRGTVLVGQRVETVEGYEIHHGRPRRDSDVEGWLCLDSLDGIDRHEVEGAVADDGAVVGTSLHGLFEADAFRATFLEDLARRRGKPFVPAGVSFAAAREAQFDRLADALEEHLDLHALSRIIAAGQLSGA